MNHDELFKLVVQTFFSEFLALFFPDVAARLDLSDVAFLNQETFTDIPEGAVRRADIVAETSDRTGEREVILVHIEIQSARRAEVAGRMFEYYALLRLRRRLKVFPLVLYLAPGASAGLTTERYNETVLGRTPLRFEYDIVSLPDLTADEYATSPEPLARALSALMRDHRSDRVERKAEALLAIMAAELDEARKSILIEVVNRYLVLNNAEKAELEGLMAREADEMLTLENFREALALERATFSGQKRVILRQLRTRFGELPRDLVRWIETMNHPDVLDAMTDWVLTANSVEDFIRMGDEYIESTR